MRYDNSLTSSVQYYIETSIAKKLAIQEKHWSLKDSAENFREFLCDPETVNTLDFVIRRYIQRKHSELLPSDADLADLTQDTNLPWDPNVIQHLADSLTALSKQQGAKIEKKEWLNYLSGTKSIRDRDKVFMIAFVLQMNVDETLDILLACGLEPYSARHPLDFICMFCQKRPGRYTWGQAEAMYKQFLKNRSHQSGYAAAPTAGMTQQFVCDLEMIFGKDQGDEEAQEELLQYMLEHEREFPVFVKIVHRVDKTGEWDVVCREKEYFLPGYSMTRTAQYQRLSQYLAILYPCYYVTKYKKSRTDNSRIGTVPVKVPLSDAGIPHLPSLTRAMLSANNLVTREFNWDESEFDSGDEEYDANSYTFEQRMKKYWNNYLQHIMAVDRLLNNGNPDSDNSPAYQNYEYYKRTDALLFLYFLVNGYQGLLSEKDNTTKLKALQELRTSGDEFDEAIDELLRKVEHISTRLRQDQYKEKAKMLRTCFDLILTQMDYMNLYLPSVFDRIFYGMLLSDDPNNLLRMVICQGEY